MRKSAFWPVLVIAIGLVGGVAGIAQAPAAPLAISVPLTGEQQVPPVQTPGSGAADLTYDPATRVVTWSITFRDLSGPATMAHFHGPAGPGKNAGVLIWLTKRGAPVTSPITGRTTLTAAQAQEFMAGQLYINVHTPSHPGGEIRGQVVPPKT